MSDELQAVVAEIAAASREFDQATDMHRLAQNLRRDAEEKRLQFQADMSNNDFEESERLTLNFIWIHTQTEQAMGRYAQAEVRLVQAARKLAGLVKS